MQQDVVQLSGPFNKQKEMNELIDEYMKIVSPEGVKSYLLIGSPQTILLAYVGSKLEEGYYGQDGQEDQEPDKWSEYPH